jgi:hypothetical protein
VFAAQHLLDLSGLDFGLERIEGLRQIAADVLTLLGPLEQDTEVIDPSCQRVAEFELVGELTPSLQGALRRGLILPEVGLADARFDPGQFVVCARGVKDSSGGRVRVSATPRSGG